METANIKEIKTELQQRSPQEVLEICLRLSKFKKENKELISYLLFEAEDEERFIQQIKERIAAEFATINTSAYYYIKKRVRKILRETKKFIRYSGKKETEVELLLYFCQKLKEVSPSITKNRVLANLYERQIAYISKKVKSLHEDLQYDYEMELAKLSKQ